MLSNGNETDTEVLYDFARRSGLSDAEDFARVYENCKASGANLNHAIEEAVRIIGDKIELENDLRVSLHRRFSRGGLSVHPRF